MPDNDINKYEKMSQLIQGMLTGVLTEDEFKVLDRMMSDDPECLKYYIEYTTIWALLDETECLTNTVNLPEYNTMTTQALKEQETSYREQPRFIAEFEDENHSHPSRSWKLVSIFLSVAAVLFIVLIIKFYSQKPYNVEIAAIGYRNTFGNREPPGIQ
jgi:hypothetical protein